MNSRKLSRRSFLETALAGGALAGTASLTITKDLFAQASGPIVIGHHCDLTGVISSWGSGTTRRPRRRSSSSTRAAVSPAARSSSSPRTPNPIRRPARASCAT